MDVSEAGDFIGQVYEYRNIYLPSTNMDFHQSVCAGNSIGSNYRPAPSLRAVCPVKIRIEKRTDYTCPDIEPIRFVDGD